MPLDYRLVVMTHGDHMPDLARALDSFAAHVSPEPAAVFVNVDGPATSWDSDGLEALRAAAASFPRIAKIEGAMIAPGLGFCGAMAKAWRSAAAGDQPWVFWLEHDFEFLLDVDLSKLALAMSWRPNLAQMALYREPVNAMEEAAGGYIGQYIGAYERKIGGEDDQPCRWVETERNWTTNPSLFRRDLCRRIGWPTVPECEGHFGFQLRAGIPGTRFGIWGHGDEFQVRHFGERTGFGY